MPAPGILSISNGTKKNGTDMEARTIFAGNPATEEWIENANFHGPIPKKVKFVDGGMISNFPINVFHSKSKSVPRKPTFGVKLSTYRDSCSDVDDLGGFVGSMISTMRHDSDNEFLIDNPDFKNLNLWSIPEVFCMKP